MHQLIMTACISLAVAGLPSPQGGAPPEPRTVVVTVTESTLGVGDRRVPVFQAVTKDGSTVVRGREGERLRIELVNRTSLPITMHPHGLILPNALDGVPFVTQLPVEPGGRFVYEFTPVQSGTYFFHSHYGWELQDQLVMPLILDEALPDGVPAVQSATAAPQEVVLMLTDLLFRSPPEVFEALRRAKPSGDAMKDGMAPAGHGMDSKKDGAAPSMPAARPDLNDVDYDAVLANGRPVESVEVVRVNPGTPLRLRIINASSATNFTVDLGSLRGTVLAADGEAVQPVEVGRIEVGIAQRFDLLIEVPAGFIAQPIVAQAEGTTLVAAIMLAAPGAALPAIAAVAAQPSGPIGVGYRQERSLRAVTPLPKRAVDRSFKVDLTGRMDGYAWSLNDTPWPKGPPMVVRKGDRVELVFTNRTMMSHPMHLHGHVFQVTEIDGERIDGAMRDTILVMPKSTVKVEFDADNPGLWMMHCHITWHEAAGMLGIVEYEGYPTPEWYLGKDTFMLPSSLPR